MNDHSHYLTEQRETTEWHKFILSNADINGAVADIGCGNGDFIKHYESQYDIDQNPIIGFENDIELKTFAECRVSSLVFCASILDDSILDDSFDTIFMSGVHQLFNKTQVKVAIENLIKTTRPHGQILISGMFNPYPVDVQMNYQYGDESGVWNLWSMQTVSEWIKTTPHEFIPFTPPDVPKHDNPMRSWTQNGILTNGTQLIQNLYTLKICL